MSFFYSFIGMLLHSIWQAGFLTLVYVCVQKLATNMHPLQRRNILYSLLTSQVFISIFTFFIYFTQTVFSVPTITNLFSLSWLNNYVNIIFSLYCIVVLYKLLSVIFQWNMFIKNYRKSLIKASGELKIFTEIKAFQLGIKRKVTVWHCKNIESPITFGFLKPMILLPFSLVNAISLQEVETIILHELAHIKSKDYLLNWLLLGMEILYFFNPFVQMLGNKIKLEREKNCDAQVLDFNYNEILYAQTLLKIAQNTVAVKSFQLGAVKHTSQLLKRIQFFSTQHNRAYKHYTLNILGWLFIPILLFTTTLFVQKKKAATNATMPYSKVLFAPIFKQKNTYPYVELANVVRIAPSQKLESKQVHVDKMMEKKIETSDITFNESAIILDDVLPVVYSDAADNIKEFLYNIETQQGKMTQSYKLIQRNGRWILEPQWMIVERNNDTAQRLQTDTIFNRIDSIQ